MKTTFSATTIAILSTILLVSSMLLIPTTNAHNPGWNIPTYSFIVVSPNPIGVGQSVNVNFWVNIPPPTASAQYGDRWTNMSVIITHPDGTKETWDLHLRRHRRNLHNLHPHSNRQLHLPDGLRRTNISRQQYSSWHLALTLFLQSATTSNPVKATCTR